MPDSSIAIGCSFAVMRFELWLLHGSLALVVTYKLPSARINKKGVLDDEMTGEPSPGRGRRLVATLMGAGDSPFVVAQQPYGA